MKLLLATLIALTLVSTTSGQEDRKPDFRWGNALYYNLDTGDSLRYNNVSVELLKVENHFNRLRVGKDTLWLKVSRRTLPESRDGVQLFVADNKFVKNLSDGGHEHDLLSKDALICVSGIGAPLLDQNDFVFPVGFNNGFVWQGEEDSYLFSYRQEGSRESGYPGIGIDLGEAKGLDKHWLLALENSRVLWVEDYPDEKSVCVLLGSESNPGIYYVYDRLYNKTLDVKAGQVLRRGEAIGTAWGDDNWGHVQIAVVYNDTLPSFSDRFAKVVNFFPQIYELYYRHTYNVTKFFTRGRIDFGRTASVSGDDKNLSAHEKYLGKGWDLGRWSTADKVEAVSRGVEGNARLRKILFQGSKAQAINPGDYFDYEINVRNGVYRVRARVGDLEEASWQRLQFEGIASGTYELKGGEQKWTTEKAVRVEDNKLTIRIFVDPKINKVAGLSEIVFQQAY